MTTEAESKHISPKLAALIESDPLTTDPNDEVQVRGSKPRLVEDKPGPVSIKSQIQINSRLADNLFNGRHPSSEKTELDGKMVRRKVHAIPGLISFIRNTNEIYDLAAKDDPYADQALLQIEAGLEAAREFIQERTDVLQQMVDSFDQSISVVSNFSISAVIKPLEFRVPHYGSLAAKLVGMYDRLVLLGLTAKNQGQILDSDWNRLITKAGTKVRHVFFIAVEFRFAGACRNDFAANNAVAISAIEKYGELPKDVLQGTKRAKHAPIIRKQGQL